MSDVAKTGWMRRTFTALRDPFGRRQRRKRMNHRILLRRSAEGAEMRRKCKQGLLVEDASASSRGLGTSGMAADATRRRQLRTLRAEGYLWIRVETEAHRSEGLLWTEQEREKFLDGLNRFFQARAKWIAEEVKKSWTRRGLTYPEVLTEQIARRAEMLHERLQPEAEEALASTEREIRGERRTRGMFYLAFASAIITGLGELVQSAPVVSSWLTGDNKMLSAATAVPLPTPGYAATPGENAAQRGTGTPVASPVVATSTVPPPQLPTPTLPDASASP